jgi:hypothetical protein
MRITFTPSGKSKAAGCLFFRSPLLLIRLERLKRCAERLKRWKLSRPRRWSGWNAPALVIGRGRPTPLGFTSRRAFPYWIGSEQSKRIEQGLVMAKQLARQLRPLLGVWIYENKRVGKFTELGTLEGGSLIIDGVEKPLGAGTVSFANFTRSVKYKEIRPLSDAERKGDNRYRITWWTDKTGGMIGDAQPYFFTPDSFIDVNTQEALRRVLAYKRGGYKLATPYAGKDPEVDKNILDWFSS